MFYLCVCLSTSLSTCLLSACLICLNNSNLTIVMAMTCIAFYTKRTYATSVSFLYNFSNFLISVFCTEMQFNIAHWDTKCRLITTCNIIITACNIIILFEIMAPPVWICNIMTCLNCFNY